MDSHLDPLHNQSDPNEVVSEIGLVPDGARLLFRISFYLEEKARIHENSDQAKFDAYSEVAEHHYELAWAEVHRVYGYDGWTLDIREGWRVVRIIVSSNFAHCM